MTIRHKIFTAGAVFFLVFTLLAVTSVLTHRAVSSNLILKDKADKEFNEIQEFAKWRNTLIGSIADIVAQGHVPPGTKEQLFLPSGPVKAGELAESGKRLIDQIAEKELASEQINQAFFENKNRINTLYYKLDEKIATVLAIAQMDRVLGADTSEQSDLAPYILKSLNQLTLVAMNSLISRHFSDEDRSVVLKNRQFLTSQIRMIDPDGSIAALFSQLFSQIESLDNLILESGRTLSKYGERIAQAKFKFDLAVSVSAPDNRIKKVMHELNLADQRLKNASRRSLITVVVFLFVVPLLVILGGIFGLNTLLLNPIRHLMTAMKDVEDGRFDVKAPVRAEDEIGQLARAFNVMAAEIRNKVIEMSRLNQDLKESESKYKTLVENLPQRIILKDRDSVFVSCNQNFVRDLGMPLENVIGKTDFDLFPEELAEKYRADDARIMQAGKPEEIEEPYFAGENKIVVQTVKTPIYGEKGEVTGILGIFWDITRRLEMEQRLKENEQRLEMALDGTNQGIWDWHMDRDKIFFSSRYYTMAGYEPGDFPGELKEWENRVHKEDLQKTKSGINRYLSGELEAFETEFRFLRKDGSYMWIHSKGKIVARDAQGNPVRFIGTHADITRQKQDEAELRRLRNYLSNIINSMPSMLVTVDGDGNITQWNNKAEQTTGLRFEQAHAQPLAKVYPRMAGEMERIRTSIRERRVVTSQKVAFKTADETRFENITIYPLVTNGVAGAVIRVDDITEQVHLEEMMIQSEKMLSVGGLAAGMAHEINNPLAGMIQTADVMAGRLRDNLHIPANQKAAEAAGTSMEAIERFLEARKIPRMLDAIRESGGRVAAIVNNMLSFARKTGAVASLNSLEKLLDKTVELAATDYDLKKQYDFKHIEIVREYAGTLPGVPCESTKIQQVLLNILRNGAQAMQQTSEIKPPRFILRTRLEAERNLAVIEIEDNGPGMDGETRKRIFEPFFTTKPVGVGTGLGLSVSYFIITKNHRGEMAVESLPGKGAKFIIRLPLEEKSGE